MKAKTKKRWERVAVWLIIVGFVFGSIAVYMIGIFGSTPDPTYTPPALNTLPEAQQQQPAASTSVPAP
ncbi:hypothetical protein EXS54_01980 [Patescibacteria group bacterium]|nr:hypothetical protein [Patescibacteria group bacterium]